MSSESYDSQVRTLVVSLLKFTIEDGARWGLTEDGEAYVLKLDFGRVVLSGPGDSTFGQIAATYQLTVVDRIGTDILDIAVGPLHESLSRMVRNVSSQTADLLHELFDEVHLRFADADPALESFIVELQRESA